MKKNLFPTLWVMIVALVMSSCAKTAYKKVIPANASVVVELDIKSVAQKADLSGQKDAIAKLVKSLDDSKETQGIANLIQNPMDAALICSALAISLSTEKTSRRYIFSSR